MISFSPLSGEVPQAEVLPAHDRVLRRNITLSVIYFHVFGEPVLKPVIATSFFSSAAAAMGALLSPVNTECTAWM
jgi:hypothetical protein